MEKARLPRTQQTKLMRFLSHFGSPPIVILAAAACWWASTQSPGLVLGQQPVADPTAISEEVAIDPLVQNLLAIAGRSDQTMGDALASLARTGNWPQVNQLLERLSKQNLSPASLVAIQKQMEPSVFLQILQSEQLSAEAKQVLQRLGSATARQQQSPEILRAAIKRLNDPSVDQRLAASRVLIAGDNASIIELVSASIAADRPAEHKALLRALLRLGSGGQRALQQVALYGTPDARRGALESLALIDTRQYAIDLMTALHSSDSAVSEMEWAQRYRRATGGQLPSRAFAVDRLLEDLDQKRQVAHEIQNTDDVSTIWSVNKQRDGVTFTKSNSIYLAYRDAADSAARLRRIGALTADIMPQVLSADLSYRLLIDPDWGAPPQIDALIQAYGPALDSNALQDSLEQALQANDHPASLGLIRLIQADGKARGTDVYLHGSGGNAAPLVTAAFSPNARIRYEAALAVMRLAAGRSFAGSSQVKRTLSEMVRLNDRPTAIIVETRPEVVAAIQQVISDLGYAGIPVESVAQLMQRIDRGGDIRLIVAKGELSDLPPIQLIDLVRRTSLGSQLPIVFYGDRSVSNGLDTDQQSAVAIRWESPIQWIGQPVTTSAYEGILDQINRQRRLPPLSMLDRQQFHRQAEEFISLPGSDS